MTPSTASTSVRAARKELLAALCDPAHCTLQALEALEQREFARAPDAPALALLAPILARGLRDRAALTKRRAALVCGNLAALCAGTAQEQALAPHLPLFQPLLETNAVGDAHPDVRLAAATALAQVRVFLPDQYWVVVNLNFTTHFRLCSLRHSWLLSSLW